MVEATGLENMECQTLKNSLLERLPGVLLEEIP